VEVKAQQDKGCRKILQGNNTGNRAVLLHPAKFQCYNFIIGWTSLYIHCSWPYTYSFPTCAKCDVHWTFQNITTGFSQGVSVVWREQLQTWQGYKSLMLHTHTTDLV